jgi:transposase
MIFCRSLMPSPTRPTRLDGPPRPGSRPRRPTPLILSAQEKAQLEALTRRQTAPRCAVQRARIILLAAQNMTVPAIAASLQMCANTVRKWIQRYTHQPQADSAPANSGPPSPAVEPPPSKLPLWADAPRSGRPDTFTVEQICQIIALACEKPQDYGRPITHWTARELKDEVIRQAIVSRISERHVHRLLSATDLQPHRSRYWLNAKPDPQKDQKIRAICDVYQQAQAAAARGEWTFSLDEMTGIQALARIAPDHPMRPGQPLRREFEYERHGTLSLLAGLEVASGQVQGFCRPTRNEADFLELVESLVQAHPQARRFTFVLDNLNTHQSESLVRYVARDAAIAESLLGVKGQAGILQTQESRSRSLCPAGISILLSATGSTPRVRPLAALIAPTNCAVHPTPSQPVAL